MNKPSNRGARPLAEFLGVCLSDAFKQQGFASAELVTRWTDIVGPEIAAHAEPMKVQWPRAVGNAAPEPGTLVLRVDGPAAIEIQHLANVILERVNRFFGWQAVDRLALRQAPLSRRGKKAAKAPDPEAAARIAAGLPQVTDDELRNALARLGAAVKPTR
ncbi:MAG TPA: DciA family protein [Xanthobacteraceae bacterium]|nr:DciA family protein [Xanthobacteraceae bacterium]